MYKHSVLDGPGTFVIRSCKFNSHLHHEPQATSTKAKKKGEMKKGGVIIQITELLLLSEYRNIF